jgi:hypothetical protein
VLFTESSARSSIHNVRDGMDSNLDMTRALGAASFAFLTIGLFAWVFLFPLAEELLTKFELNRIAFFPTER